MTVMYLFVREKFHWTVRDYTFFETVSHLVPMIGALIGFLILRKVSPSQGWKKYFINFIFESLSGIPTVGSNIGSVGLLFGDC